MKRRRKATSTAAPPQGSSAEEAASPPARSTPTAAPSDGQKDARPHRRRGDGSLEDRISYRFADLALLDSALSHISALKGVRNRGGSYQRLEFLGDHVLGLVISDMLFRAFPRADEGELSRRLADLVRKETCAEIARAIDLGAAVRLGASEANAGARNRPAILADVCEAVIAAIYLDAGFHKAAAFIAKWWEPLVAEMEEPPRDPKTSLQEWAQARGLERPSYDLVETAGPDHAPRFTVAARVPGYEPATATASSKRAAETKAAALLLTRVENG